MSSLSSVKSRPEMASSIALPPAQVIRTQEDQSGQAETTSTSSGSRRARRIQPQKESPIDAMPIEVLCQIMMFDPRFRHRKVSRQFQRAFDYMAGLYWDAMKGGFPEGCLSIRSRIDAIEQEPGLSGLQKSILLRRQILPFSRGVKAPLNRWYFTLPKEYFQIQNQIGLEDYSTALKDQLLATYPHLKIPESSDELQKWGEEEAGAIPIARLEIGCKASAEATKLPELVYHLSQLKRLSIYDAKSLVYLSESLGNLTALRTFCIQGAQLLTEIPESFQRLSSLQTLSLTTCPLLSTLPPHLGKLDRLRSLHLIRCHSLKEIPESIGELHQLESIEFKSLFYIKRVPESIRNLTNLLTLKIEDCTELEEIPTSLSRLTNLFILKISGCSSLKATEIFISSSQIQSVDIDDWKRLRHLVFEAPLPLLQMMKAKNCYALQHICGFEGEMPNLKIVDFAFSTLLKQLPDFPARAPSLWSLNLGYCASLKRLPDSLGEASRLRHIYLDGIVLEEASSRLTHSTNKVIAEAVLARLKPKVGVKRERDEGEQVPPKRSKHDVRE